MRKLGESKFLRFGPAAVETVTRLTATVSARPSRPVEPVKLAWLTVQHERQSSSGPATRGSVARDPPSARGRGRTAPSRGEPRRRGLARRSSDAPRSATPSDERTDLLGDVRHQVLHEPRQIPRRGSHDQVHVIGENAEGEELDAVQTNGARQYAAEDFVRLLDGRRRSLDAESSAPSPSRSRPLGTSELVSATTVPPSRDSLKHEPRQTST